MNQIKGMTLKYRYVVFVGNEVLTVDKDCDDWEELKSMMLRKRYRSNLLVWRPYLSQWKCIPNIPFFLDVRLPKGFVLMLGPSFRNPADVGHELSVYLQTLEWLEKERMDVKKKTFNRRKAFWKTQHLRLLMPSPSCLSAPFRDGWFENNNQHFYLSSYSLELMHQQYNPNWDWIKSWFKSQFNFSICCAQKKLPETPHCPSSILIQDLYPVPEIRKLVNLSRKHLRWRKRISKTIEHLYLHTGHTVNIPPNYHSVNIQLLSPFHLFQLLQTAKRIYRSHLLPCTEMLTIGLSVSGGDVYLPNSFLHLDPQFQNEQESRGEEGVVGKDGP